MLRRNEPKQRTSAMPCEINTLISTVSLPLHHRREVSPAIVSFMTPE